MSRRSIIPYTTTCPECGHRLLPKNLDKHIRDIHPYLLNDQQFLEQIHTKQIPSCPYCGIEIEHTKLENHIYESHREKALRAAEDVDRRLKEEQRERKKKLRNLAKQNDARIIPDRQPGDSLPSEPRLAHQKPKTERRKRSAQTSPKGKVPFVDDKQSSPTAKKKNQGLEQPSEKRQAESVICTVCGVKLHPKRLPRHMKKVHSGPVIHHKFGSTLPNEEEVPCPICKRIFYKSFVDEHIKRHHK
jgi:DNA-directed RNA polymerase subunit RPC12/RpoP